MRRLLGAFAFLTILPVPGTPARVGESALFFPLIGALLGAGGALLLNAATPPLGSAMAALATLGLWTFLTGGLHEDGVADVADAIRPNRSRARMMAILKDSRIGAFGAMALVFLFAVRWQALMRLPSQPVAELAACLGMSRAALVIQAYVSRPIGEGLGKAFADDLRWYAAVLVLLQALALAVATGTHHTLPLLGGGILLTWLLYQWFDHRLGGVNGDCLGATCLIVETFLLVIVSCQNCFW